MKRLALALACSSLLAGSASAGGSVSLGTSWQGGGQHSSWIEQQQITATTPTNPFGGACLWSVNDHEYLTSMGYLDPGQSVSFSRCVVSDAFPGPGSIAPYGFSTVRVSSKSPDITVSVCFSQGRCFFPAPIWNASARQYQTTFCGKVERDWEDPAIVPIEGSQGGEGEISSVTTTISSPTSRRVRGIFAEVGYASDIAVFMGWPDAVGCLPTIPYVDHFEYPFEWTNS